MHLTQREPAADPVLREAYDHLKTALRDPNLRKTVVNLLRGLVLQPQPR